MREALKDVDNNIILDMVNGDRSKLSSEILLEAVKSEMNWQFGFLMKPLLYGIGYCQSCKHFKS